MLGLSTAPQTANLESWNAAHMSAAASQPIFVGDWGNGLSTASRSKDFDMKSSGQRCVAVRLHAKSVALDQPVCPAVPGRPGLDR